MDDDSKGGGNDFWARHTYPDNYFCMAHFTEPLPDNRNGSNVMTEKLIKVCTQFTHLSTSMSPLTSPVQTRTFDLYALLRALYHFCENHLTSLYKTSILRHSRKIDGF